ncbi:MAG: FAD-binding protein [bacterium]|nr:FAD-binding protein [bacterium]
MAVPSHRESNFSAISGEVRQVLGEIKGKVRFREPLSSLTSLRVGGSADFLIVPMDVDDIRRALDFARRDGLPVIVIGCGANVIVPDGRLRGVVLHLRGCLGRAKFWGEEVLAGVGVYLPALIREAAALNLGGIECLVGIPATVGGAIATSAGTPDGNITEFVNAVDFVHADGAMGQWRQNGRNGGWRLELPPGAVVVAARLRLKRRPLADIQRDVKKRLKIKKVTEPRALAATPIWENGNGHSAVKLIERTGLKGKRLNDAEISMKNPNFIVNRGRATAADVLALMEVAEERVQAQFGIQLQRAVRVIGQANGTGSH